MDLTTIILLILLCFCALKWAACALGCATLCYWLSKHTYREPTIEELNQARKKVIEEIIKDKFGKFIK